MIIKRYFTVLIQEKLFTVLAIISIFPLFILSVFNNPGSDDFDYEFKRPLQEIIQTQIELYNGWSGRYFSVGFMAINPDVFIKYSYYKFYPVIIICLFISVLYWFLKTLLLKIKTVFIASDWGFLLFLFCLQVPNICQTFFWYSSSICYQFGIVLFLIFITSAIKYDFTKSSKYLILAIFALIAAIGSNEILMLIMLILGFCYILVKLFILKIKITNYEKFLLATLFIFSIIVIVAPGNSARLVRTGITDNHNFIFSIVKSLYFLLKYTFEWFPLLLLASYLYSNRLYQILDTVKNKNIFIHPIYCLIIAFTTLFTPLFSGFWELNNVLPVRTINTIYFFFILFAIYFIFCTLNFLNYNNNYKIILPESGKYVLSLALLLMTFSESPISEAYFDLFSGKAYKYNKEMRERFKIINFSNGTKIKVPMLENCPKTIYASEVMGLTSDANNWKNDEISKYYKKQVTIQPNDSVFSE